jgi:transposase
MNPYYFIGADISKATIDFSLLKESECLLQEQTDNTPQAIRTWLAKVKKEYKAGGKNTLFCMEYTGPYNGSLIQVLQKAKANVWVESALQIKLSLGMQRGKNDKIDSYRIAQYAALKRECFQPYQEQREVIQRLKQLSGLRHRLQKMITGLQKPTKEISRFKTKQFTKEIMAYYSSSLKALKEDLSRVETAMREEVQWDERLNHLYEILTSIPLIGKVVAVELIIATNEFRKFDSAKKFACYAGVAPFEHTSGTSVRGKSRVSKMANRKVKTLFFMPALGVARCKGELKDYYERKIEEGHAKRSVQNAVKNKLISRIFACVKEDRLYQREHKLAPI